MNDFSDSAGPRPLHVLGIAGSLREGSYNRALLRAARDLAPEGMNITLFERMGEIPLYNADLDTDADRPEAVRALKQAIDEADALLFATPEYNYGVPGVLKNAIDWASRPAYRSVLADKPSAIMGASRSTIGTARGQTQLRETLYATLSPVLPSPGVLVGQAPEKFDEQNRLTDEKTRTAVRDLLEALAAWTRRLKVADTSAGGESDRAATAGAGR